MRRPAFAGAKRDPEAVAADLEALPARPLISVVMPTYETEPRHLREAIWSVTTQEYPDWELVIVDDGSTDRSTRRELTRWDARDERIVVRMLDRNSGISAATNQAIEHSRGELVAFLDHDDALTADALLHIARAFGDAEIDIAYSDQDKITERGRAHGPLSEARLVPGLRPRRDVRRAPARRPSRADPRGRRPRSGLRRNPGLRAPAADVGADRPDPPHRPDPLPLAGDSREALRSTPPRSPRSTSCRPGR